MWEHGKAAGFQERASERPGERETLTARPTKEPLAVAFSYFAAQPQPLLIFKVSTSHQRCCVTVCQSQRATTHNKAATCYRFPAAAGLQPCRPRRLLPRFLCLCHTETEAL